jgi:hypothetical protein
MRRGADPDGLRRFLRDRAASPSKYSIKRFGNLRQLGRLAERFGVSPEDARQILKEEGWELRWLPSGLGEWRPRIDGEG